MEPTEKQETRVRKEREKGEKKVPCMSRLSQSVEMTSNDHLEREKKLVVRLRMFCPFDSFTFVCLCEMIERRD